MDMGTNNKLIDPTASRDQRDFSRLLEEQLHDAKGKAAQLNFYVKRVNALECENSNLTTECQRLTNRISSSQKREEDLIDSLVETQLRVDQLESECETYRRRMRKLTNNEANKDDAQSGPYSNATSDSSNRHRITQMEREIDVLRAQLGEATQQAYPKAANWKYLEAQRDRLEARRELATCQAMCESLQDRLETVESARAAIERELIASRAEAEAGRTAHAEHTSTLEAQIERLTNQTLLLRRKGAKLAAQEFRQMEEAELEELHRALQILRNEVARLKHLTGILRGTCEALKNQVGHVTALETEVGRLRIERRNLRRQLAKFQWTEQSEADTLKQAGSNQADEIRRKLLKAEVDNRRLNKLVDELRNQLIRSDPFYATRYHYITGV